VSSPRKAVWGEWGKLAHAAKFYMPPFSLDELLRCRAIAFPHIAEARVEALFARWGGSARFVLELSGNIEQADLILSATSAARNADLVKAIETVSSADGGGEMYATSPHVLFHLVMPAGLNALPILTFASDFCRDIVFGELSQQGVGAVRRFLLASESSNVFGSLRGYLFERLAPSTLFHFSGEAQTWDLVPLDGGEAGSVTESGSRPVAAFSTIDELVRAWDTAPMAVGRPRSSNWPSWDAITRNEAADEITFWQMTVSSPRAHGMKGDGFARADALVSDATRVRLVFVVLGSADSVPPSHGNVRITGTPPAWTRRMRQFVLMLPLAEAVERSRVETEASIDEVAAARLPGDT
jgi:hypothetical protein